ncbi:MAG: GTPase Era [Lachnospiraceae bacterium]|nr:GTPase Era [Lachnospiraceae bacterium]
MTGDNTKSGIAALIGRPNVGKSTLMNHLIGQKIAITSRKPQTTRNKIQTVYTEERGQIIFMDTPGIHRAKNKLGEYMVTAAAKTLDDADVVLWLVEPADHVGSMDEQVIKLLRHVKVPVILVINKVDRIKKDMIPDIIKLYEKEMHYDDIIAVSALQGRNLDTLIDAVFRYLPYGPLYYDEDTITDQPVKQIASELIREKVLRCLGEEVPHGVAVTIDKMEERKNGVTDIEAVIICERESHKGMIIGKGGAKLKEIGSLARADIEELIEGKVNLQLWVKVRNRWRDSDVLVKNYGYDIKKV